MGAFSALFINHHFRNKLKLGNYGRMSSYLSVVAIPACVSTLFHTTVSSYNTLKTCLTSIFQFIQSHVILRLYDCPTCLQTRAAFFQAGTAVFYPFLLAPLAAFMFATRHFTYRLPSITSQPKEVFKLYLKFTRSAGSLTGILLGVNMLGAMYITSRQMMEHANINFQLEEFEKKIESGSISNSEFV